jgi:hypothetical protein
VQNALLAVDALLACAVLLPRVQQQTYSGAGTHLDSAQQ